MIRKTSDLAPVLTGRPAFVPTMGALHEGHLSLVRRALRSDIQVVASIFVNPTQFGPDEDLETYPRSTEQDIEMLREEGVDVVFAPDQREVYPGGMRAADRSAATFPLPEVGAGPGLEDACRRHFFGGVCLVVSRLFDLVRPGPAFFGEKDYQQLKVISAMVAGDSARFEGVEVIGCPTVREADGLAMSSRNAYLSEESRERALGIHRALAAAQGAASPREAELCMAAVLESSGLRTEYAVVRDAENLAEVRDLERPMRALIAARLDEVRLIDNAPYHG